MSDIPNIAADTITAAADTIISNGKLIATFLSGAVVAIFAEPIRRWLFSPKVEIHFGTTLDFRAPATAHTNGAVHGETIFMRAKVICTSRATAKKCRAYLVNIEQRNERTGNFDQTIHSDSLALKWACKRSVDEQLSFIDIPRGVNQYFDILHTMEWEPTKFLPDVEFIPSRYRELMNKPGVFRLTVMVAGEELRPVYKHIVFTWTGAWNTFTQSEEQQIYTP